VKDIATPLADSLITGHTGDFFGGPIERCYPPIMVDGKNTIGNRVKDNSGLVGAGSLDTYSPISKSVVLS